MRAPEPVLLPGGAAGARAPAESPTAEAASRRTGTGVVMAASNNESGKSLGLCGGSEIWLMEPAVEDSGADLEQAVCADR